MDRFIRTCLVSLALLQITVTTHAQTKDPSSSSAVSATPLSAESMWTLKRVGDPVLSPDGKLAVVPVTRFDVGENKGYTELWLFDTAAGRAPRQLTSGNNSANSAVFSPNSRLVAFVARRPPDEQAQIYVIPVDGGEATRVTNVPTGVSVPKWMPDGRHLAFISAIWMDLARWEDQGKRMKERAESKMSARVWDKAPIAYWDHLLDDRELHIFTVGLEGGEPVAVTRTSGYSLPKGDLDSFSYDISPDGAEVAFSSDIDKTGVDANQDIITVAACGCKPATNLTPDNPAPDFNPQYSPDGKLLAYGRQRLKDFYADRTSLMIRDRASGSTRDVTEKWDRSASNLVWLPDSKSLVASIDDAGTTRVYRFDIRGGTPKALTKSPSFTAIDTKNNVAVATRQSFTEPPTLVRLDLRTGAATKLSTFNDAALSNVKFGKYESVTYKGARNDDIQMWVVYPPDFDPARKYPVYMLLHGGPHNGSTDGTQWRWNAEVFAGWGYVVTWHNFHGSSGFGQEFTDSINPDRISMPYEDTIKAADWLMQQPYVDRDRMAAGGGSYGGFLAATLLGREHPFKTIIAHAAVYNNFTQIAADYGASKPRFGYFWEKPEEFARFSPHTSAGNFKTPTLVIHGQMDQRVPVNQGIELFNTLQSKGVPSKLVYFPDENHWVLKPQNSLFWYKTVREWLAQYVPPGAR